MPRRPGHIGKTHAHAVNVQSSALRREAFFVRALSSFNSVIPLKLA